MKVLIVITQGNVGGATNSVFWLAKKLKERNIGIKVGFGEGDYLKEKLEKEDIDYVNFKWLKRTHNPLANLFFIFEIKNFLKKEKFDIVHFNSTNALFGAIGAKLRKTKVIFTFRGLSILDFYYKKHLLLKPIYWFVFKFLLFFVDIPVFVSKDNLEYARKIKLTKEGVVIYNGIPKSEFFEKERARKFFEEKLGVDFKDKFIIGSIGRLDYQKNYEFLISIFPKILKIKEKAICLIIGDGPERKKLENLIKNLNLEDKVFLLGEIKNASEYLKGFDLFILPSRYEGLSITLIEALFAEIPIIASDVGGNKEIIGEENVYKLDDEKELLEKIKNTPKINFENQKNFTLEAVTNNYLNLYRNSYLN